MIKQEKIQDAYGIHWEFYKDKVDENGWVDCRKIGHGNLIAQFDTKDIQFQKHKQRPKSIQGINDNNGWALGAPPKDGGEFWIIEAYFKEPIHVCNVEYYDEYFATIDGIDFQFSQREITHYQPIKKPLKPIY